jgi:transposase, IS5 family
VYGDSAYASQKALIASKAAHARDFTNQRVRKAGEIDEAQRSRNRNKSKVRARVEHVFAVVKRLWGFTKVRYRGLAKNASLVRGLGAGKHLPGAQASCGMSAPGVGATGA